MKKTAIKNKYKTMPHIPPIPVTLNSFAVALMWITLSMSIMGKQIPSEDKQSDWFKSGNARLGLESLDKEYVPEPWQPISYSAQEQAIAVWNRVYSIEGDMFLSGIKCGDLDLLSGPISINITINEAISCLALDTPEILTKQSGKGRWVLERIGKFAGIDVKLTYTVEYDGLIWCELKINVPDTKSKINHLQLIIPFQKNAAQLIHYVGAPSTYTTQNTSDQSFSNELSLKPGNLYKSSFKTMVWIGNTQYGLLWCSQSDQFWWPLNRKDCLHADRNQDGTVQFTIDMVASPLPDSAPSVLTYSFGLMGTPVKPRPEGWRAWTFSTQWDSFAGVRRGSNVIYWPNEYRFMAMDPDPGRYINVEHERKKIARDVSQGRRILPYWSRLNICPQNMEDDYGNPGRKIKRLLPDADYMIGRWSVAPNNPAAGKEGAYSRLSANTGWADYLVWCVNGFAEKMGHIDGVYLDEVQPIPDTRKETLSGYDDFYGNRRPTFEFFGTRNLLKRMAYTIYQRNQKLPLLVAHCSATQTLNSLSPCDVLLIGEQFNISYLKSYPDMRPPAWDSEEKQYYYSYALPMDRVRAECFGRQWGEVILWLPQLRGQSSSILKNPVTTRDMLSRIIQADVLVWPIWCNEDEVYKTWQFRKEFDIGSEVVEFVPYWENTVIKAQTIKSDNTLKADPEVVVGFYNNKARGTYLVLVSNLSRKPCEAELSFEDIPVISIKNAETNANLQRLPTGKYRLKIKRNDYAALRVNY